jgi:hypothetical protein
MSARILAVVIVVLAPSLGLAAEPAPPKAPADVPACPSGEDQPDVAGVVKRFEEVIKGRSSIGTMTMAIKTTAWSRSLKLKIWSQGKDLALIRVLEGGPRETGMMTLKREKQLWNWLPQAGRVMKLPSGMMGDSWMGSDFTNDDLVKGSSLTDEYTSSISGIEHKDGHEVWHVVLKPKPNAAVVWGRVDLLIDRQSCLPVLELFYDEENKVARSMEFSDFRQIGWRQFPAKMTIHPAEAGRETSITYGDLEFDSAIPADTFSLERLRAGR